MIKQLIVATSLLMSIGVFAEEANEWQYLNHSEHYTEYYNLARINKVIGSQSNEVQLWIKMVVTKETVFGDRVGDYLLVKKQIRCADGFVKYLQATTYSNTGTLINNDIAKVSRYSDSIPDSLEDHTVKLTCAYVFK